MPIEIIEGKSVFTSRNKTSKYPSPSKDPERYLPYPTVSHQAAFEIKPDDKIFTIGSCFARNTERALISLGMPVLSALVEGIAPDENITNKYTTKSILHDLQVAFTTPEKANNTIYEDTAGGFVNLTFGGSGAQSAKPLADVEDLTNRYFANLKKIESANIVILTLGLVEVWFDKQTQTYLNLMPSVRALKKNPSRFEMHVLSYDDIISDVNEILSIIRKHAQPGVRFLVTVSPVPLHATFRDQDCMQANMYSKSVQRAAVDSIRLSNKDVAYFPSYEMVTMAAPDKAWVTNDFRHVRGDLVDRIMRTVLSHYLTPGVLPPSKEEFQEWVRFRDYTAIKDAVELHLQAKSIPISEGSLHVQYYYARALAATGRHEEALHAIRFVTKAAPKHSVAKDIQVRLEAKLASNEAA